MDDAPESVVVAMWTCIGGVCLFTGRKWRQARDKSQGFVISRIDRNPKVIERNCIILTDSFRFAGLFFSHPTYI